MQWQWATTATPNSNSNTAIAIAIAIAAATATAHPNNRKIQYTSPQNADNFSHLVDDEWDSNQAERERKRDRGEGEAVLKFNFLQFVEHINRTFWFIAIFIAMPGRRSLLPLHLWNWPKADLARARKDWQLAVGGVGGLVAIALWYGGGASTGILWDLGSGLDLQ